jgi:hypothetical protein
VILLVELNISQTEVIRQEGVVYKVVTVLCEEADAIAPSCFPEIYSNAYFWYCFRW